MKSAKSGEKQGWRGACSSSTLMVKARRTQRGVTLMELLVVIVMVGILAALATQYFSGQVASSRVGETFHMVGLIKMAQENYRAETGHYLNASDSIDDCYPHGDASLLGTHNFDFHQADGTAWQRLGVSAQGKVDFCYSVRAGDIGDAVPAISLSDGDVTFPQPDGPWYVIRAMGDPDVDGRHTIVVGSSFSDRIAIAQDDGEPTP